MNAKHTPGPWKVKPNAHGDGLNPTRSVESEDLFIATVDFCTAIEANARLIAAAPELLEALQWMLDAYDNEEWCNTRENKAARAAIAKATGESE